MVQMISTLFCAKKGGIFVQLYWKRVFEDKLLGIYLFGTHSTFSVNHAIRTTCCKEAEPRLSAGSAADSRLVQNLAVILPDV